MKIPEMLNKEVKQQLSDDYGIECIPYYPIPNFGSTNASVPLTRRERRALKRKEKKYGNTK